ncbi:MAG: tail fiber protein [Burkholderiales bacterium]|nr:tail fiber protein [Burkholderiales bacterium]
MSEPFLGEIRIVAFPHAPKGYAQCQGQRMPIAQNSALFSLLGVAYGGDGQHDFALPDLRARVPMGLNPGSGSARVDLGRVSPLGPGADAPHALGLNFVIALEGRYPARS